MKLYMFKKSGSIVEMVNSDTVRRIDTGKRMHCTPTSLIPLKQLRVCSYCIKEVGDLQICCKEVHNELIWVTDDGDLAEVRVPGRKDA